jgi:ParB family transcriptional regulator, chromosome partitioning protein
MDREYQDEFALNLIAETGGGRPINGEAVAALMDSIQKIGLQTPLLIREIAAVTEGGDDRFEPIAGRHRITALRRLGWKWVPVFLIRCSDVEARMLEIVENLHRHELSRLERAEQIAEWLRLSQGVQSDQVDQFESKREDGRGHRRTGGVSEAARDLCIDRGEATRATKIDALSEGAKRAAEGLGLQDNATALLQAAKYADPEDQIQALQDFVADRAERQRERQEAKAQGPQWSPRPAGSGGTEMSDADARRLAAEELDGWWSTWSDEVFAIELLERLLAKVRAQER